MIGLELLGWAAKEVKEKIEVRKSYTHVVLLCRFCFNRDKTFNTSQWSLWWLVKPKLKEEKSKTKTISDSIFSFL